MKALSLFASFVLLVFCVSCQKNEGTTSAITTYAQVGEAKIVPGNYGDLVNVEGVISLLDMQSKVESEGTFEGKVSGVIQEVCTKKGCWFEMALPNGNAMRVTFKDYGFFIPTNSQGFPITVQGVATFSETDVETLRHYAEDLGKSKEEVASITVPKKEITFVASGVVVNEKA